MLLNKQRCSSFSHLPPPCNHSFSTLLNLPPVLFIRIIYQLPSVTEKTPQSESVGSERDARRVREEGGMHSRLVGGGWKNDAKEIFFFFFFLPESVEANRVYQPEVLPFPALCLLHFPLSHGINRTDGRIDASVPMEPNLTNTCAHYPLLSPSPSPRDGTRLVVAFYALQRNAFPSENPVFRSFSTSISWFRKRIPVEPIFVIS